MITMASMAIRTLVLVGLASMLVGCADDETVQAGLEADLGSAPPPPDSELGDPTLDGASLHDALAADTVDQPPSPNVDDRGLPRAAEVTTDTTPPALTDVSVFPGEVGAEDQDAPLGEDLDSLDAGLLDTAEGVDLAPGDAGAFACVVPRPILLVHGINGSSADYAVMVQRLIAAGWPPDLLYTFDAVDPSWTCNVDNAAAIDALVSKMMAETGQDRIDLIAHSMGTLSTRYWLKFLGGQEKVNTYVTLGGMHHGLASPCWAPAFLGVCVWSELCESAEYVASLNAAPATPGELHWVSLIGTADATVPNASSTLAGAENITFEGVEHSGPNGLLEVAEVFEEVLRVLAYPCW